METKGKENSNSDFQRKIRYQFESFCKKVICNERYDYLHWLLRHMEHVTNFSALSDTYLEDIRAEDGFPEEEHVFRVCGYCVPLRNERLIEALLCLAAEERSILLLYYSLGLKDREIAELLCTSRSRVERLRIKVLNKLQEEMRR